MTQWPLNDGFTYTVSLLTRNDTIWRGCHYYTHTCIPRTETSWKFTHVARRNKMCSMIVSGFLSAFHYAVQTFRLFAWLHVNLPNPKPTDQTLKVGTKLVNVSTGDGLTWVIIGPYNLFLQALRVLLIPLIKLQAGCHVPCSSAIFIAALPKAWLIEH